jgi:hypothetical protein
MRETEWTRVGARAETIREAKTVPFVDLIVDGHLLDDLGFQGRDPCSPVP